MTKVIVKHNGTILDEYGYGNIYMDLGNSWDMNEHIKAQVTRRIQFRNTDRFDFEYGIGGFVGDEYYKIKSIKLADNRTTIIVKVSKA